MFLNKKILCLIPARGGSKEIKLKNLRKINKKNLLEISIEFAKSLKFLDKIVVSSDHKKILNFSKKQNVTVERRSKKLSKDFVSDYELIKDISQKSKKFNYDYILYLQPTSPFRRQKDFKAALKMLIKRKDHGIWSVTKVDKKFHPDKILLSKNNKHIGTFTQKAKRIVARQQLGETYIRNGIFYFFSVKEIQKQKSIYLKKTNFFEINYDYINIDTLKDLRNSKILAKKLRYEF